MQVLLDTPYSKMFKDATNQFEEWEQEPQPKEAFEIEKAKKNKNCNFRNSLAWDSAFFTSAGISVFVRLELWVSFFGSIGFLVYFIASAMSLVYSSVLDPEELSSIIEGVENDEKHALLGIQEDVHKSCESIFTLESDSLTLESLEAGLFEDRRASIQKSSKMSSAINGNRIVPSGTAVYQTSDSSKKVGMASQKKALPASKNTSANMQGSGKMTKKNPISPQVPQKLVATRGELSILKQPKVPGKSSPSSTSAKRTSLGDLHVKNEKDKTKREISGRVSLVSKAPVLGGSQGFMPKAIPSFNSSSGQSNPNKIKSATSASSGINSSDNIGRSAFKSSKRKVDAGTITVSSSGSAVHKGRDKTDPGNPSLSGLMPVTKLSSSISPASSSSDWSSESSSLTSMTKCRSNSSTTSLGSSSGKKVLSDTDTSQASNSQNPSSAFISEGQETQEARFKSQSARTTSARAVLPLASMKPSGLRLPSPKIGFFDGGKSLVRTPRG